MRLASLDIVTLRPISCGAVLWRAAGGLRVTVVVKATFGLVHGASARLIAPIPLTPWDRHHDKRGTAGVEAASDLAPALPSAGAVLTGHAYAPPGTAVPALSVRLGVFRDRPLIDKVIHVFGERDPAAPGRPSPFQRMPLRWERAAGGPGVAANPLGTGASTEAPAPPNLVDPADPRRPACYAPVPASFPARRGALAAAARAELDKQIPDLPLDFPFGFFQAAPPDQTFDTIRGDEQILLDGLHPALPRVNYEAAVGARRGAMRAATHGRDRGAARGRYADPRYRYAVLLGGVARERRAGAGRGGAATAADLRGRGAARDPGGVAGDRGGARHRSGKGRGREGAPGSVQPDRGREPRAGRSRR